MTAKEPMYEFTVWETGETWVGTMPEGSPIPNAKVTIGFPATEHLVVQRTACTNKITPEKLLNLRIDGNLTLRDLLSLAECEGQLTTKDYGDDSSFNDIAQCIINAVLA